MRDMTRILTVFFITVFMTIILPSCHHTPKGVLSEKKMTKLLIDLHKAEGLTEIEFRKYASDSMKLQVKQAVYNRHNIDQATFDSSLMYYGHHLDRYSEIYENVIKELEEEVEKAGSVAIVTTTIMGDSVNAWNGAQSYVLNHRSPSNRLEFNLEKDHAWEKGDSYTLQFKTFNKINNGEAAMFIDYDNNSTDYITNQVEEDGWTRITVVMDTLRNPVNVYGFIDFDLRPDEEIFIDSLSLVRRRFEPAMYRRRHNQSRFNFTHDAR